MLNLSPIFRLSAGLTLLTVSLLLTADFLGLMPNETRLKSDSRKVIAELLAVQVSEQIGQGDLDLASESLLRLQTGSKDVESVAIKLTNDELLHAAGNHQKYWKPLSNGQSTFNHVEVPIYQGVDKWGSLQISFSTPNASFLAMLSSGSLNVVIAFFCFFGFAVYWLFLKRSLKELDPRSVIPERVNVALNVLTEGLVMLDRSGRIVLVNDAFEKKVNLEGNNLIGKNLSDFDWKSSTDETPPDGIIDFPWHTTVDTNKPVDSCVLELETAFNGTLKFDVNSAPISAGDGNIRGVIVTFDDVTEVVQRNVDLTQVVSQLKSSKVEIEQKNRELEILATRDPLTGALNRRALYEGMYTLARDALRLEEPLSCIMVDIDHFKSINDQFGHSVGDEVIKLMANILTSTVDAGKLVGRYGGEEFVVALPETGEVRAAEIAEKIRVTLANSEGIKSDTDYRITASFGVACDHDGQLAVSDLIDRADKALYRAKDSGRNRVVKYSALDQPHDGFTDVQTPDVVQIQESGNDKATQGVVSQSNNTSLVSTLSSQTSLNKAHFNNAEANANIVLLDRLTQGIERGKRFGSYLAVMYIHIDALEVVNNTYGSVEVEKTIASISARLKTVLRKSDVVHTSDNTGQQISVSRAGIAELMIVLTDVKDAGDTTWIIKRLSDALQLPITHSGTALSADSRMGISLYPGDSQDAQSLLANARSALRDAKNSSSRNCCLFFDEQMNIRAEKQLLLEGQLQQALDKDEFFLMYQPLVSLTDGKLTGFETLVRWRNSELGVVPPDQFIPVAEHAQLIDAIGYWIFNRALQQLKRWRDKGHTEISIAVNVSAIQLRQPEFVDQVASLLEKHSVPASVVTIELTESIIIEDMRAAVEKIDRLQAIGFRVALDDFGTGYSSLSYLKDMPIDAVKIDRSFFSDFPKKERDVSIVSAIISLAHSLGLSVVAEGVETEDQLAAIFKMNCNMVQGYVFSAPKLPEEITVLLGDSVKQRRFLRLLTNLQVSTNAELSSYDGVISRFSH